MGKVVTESQPVDWRLNWLYKISAAAAMIAMLLLLIGVPSLLSSVLPAVGIRSWLSAFQDNWLIVIFKLHAGMPGTRIGMLQGVDLVDSAVLTLAAITHLGLYAALRRTSRTWSVVAAIQPFLGILLFVVTKNAGRSAVMGAGLVVSLVMLRSATFRKTTAYFGIASNVLLLIGDFSASMPPSRVVATLFGLAYVLLIAWFFQVGQRLFLMGQGTTLSPA
jgi:hypothetical protein